MDPLSRLSDPDAELLRTARRAAERAAGIHRSRGREGRAAEWVVKGRSDFVSEVDLEAERAVVEAIRERFPEHGILAEEAADRAGTPGESRGEGKGATAGRDAPEGRAAPNSPPLRWVVDPLDGTTNWLHGYPEYAVSIAAEDREGPRVGVVLDSATGERFEAVRGAGAWKHGGPGGRAAGDGGARRVRVSEVSDLSLALVATGFPFKKLELMEPYLEVFRRVLSAASGIRRGGSAALDLCHLACGRVDAFWELWLQPWDVAAGALIVREAGGAFRAVPVARFGAGEPAGADPAPIAELASRADAGAGGPSACLASNARLLEVFTDLVLAPDPAAGR